MTLLLLLAACAPDPLDSDTGPTVVEVDTPDAVEEDTAVVGTCEGHYVGVRAWLGRPNRSCWEPVEVDLRVDWWQGYCDLANGEGECSDAEVIWPTVQHTCLRLPVTCDGVLPASDPWIGDCDDAPDCCDPAVHATWTTCPEPEGD